MSQTRVRPPLDARGTALLAWADRIVFFAIGLMLFVAAFALLARSTAHLAAMFVAPDVVVEATALLDLVLLVLMLVELAYTVVLSLRGVVLVPEPFLIVGLIAVIRRILVITVGEVKGAEVGATGAAAAAAGASGQALLELGVLTGVVLAFVIAIVLLRRLPREPFLEEQD